MRGVWGGVRGSLGISSIGSSPISNNTMIIIIVMIIIILISITVTIITITVISVIITVPKLGVCGRWREDRDRDFQTKAGIRSV